jgi:hypothetical protein
MVMLRLNEQAYYSASVNISGEADSFRESLEEKEGY